MGPFTQDLMTEKLQVYCIHINIICLAGFRVMNYHTLFKNMFCLRRGTPISFYLQSLILHSFALTWSASSFFHRCLLFPAGLYVPPGQKSCFLLISSSSLFYLALFLTILQNSVECLLPTQNYTKHWKLKISKNARTSGNTLPITEAHFFWHSYC